jgi:hypothetical protein
VRGGRETSDDLVRRRQSSLDLVLLTASVDDPSPRSKDSKQYEDHTVSTTSTPTP